MQSIIQTKKKNRCHERKADPPRLGVQEESIVNRNNFGVLSILYIENLCETRKTNSNAIRAPFLLLNFRKSWK